ncbi:hypothetical protein NQ315_012794 [Exocentrus adspersus]|uniref:CCHC-type domain-containing protein n=1 Tax=Exocentrus adspersus TaxID=1586481 RepID=A0AAV8VBX3_9CUCU|nr:hypothetical protein NQ315_012794 [Exocentrus adspersus]
MPQNGRPGNPDENADHDEGIVEPYKLSEVFSIVPEFEGDQIVLGTFLNACEHAFSMAVGEHRKLLIIHIKNKLKGRAAQLINSRNPATWDEIKQLLSLHFGDSRDLTSLIQDLQRMRQLPNESALTFFSRLQTHNAKMHSAVHKAGLTREQKTAQSQLIETMTLNTLLTGLEPRLAHIIRAGNPNSMLEALHRIKRELQLSYFENQKFDRTSLPRNNPNQQNRPIPNQPKLCNTCKRTGHTANECRVRQQPATSLTSSSYRNVPYNSQNYPSQPQQYPPRPFPVAQQQQQLRFQQPNHNQRPVPQPGQRPNQYQTPRPSVIQPNPNYNQPRTHHVNINDDQYYCSDQYQQFTDDFFEQPDPYYVDNPNYEYYDQDFHLGLQSQEDPPDYAKTNSQNLDTITNLQEQVQTMNLDDMNPNLNFPEQSFI